MPAVVFFSSLPQAPPASSQSGRYFHCHLFFSCFSKEKSCSLTFEPHKGNRSPVIIPAFFHGKLRAKSMQFLAREKNRELPTRQKIELLDWDEGNPKNNAQNDRFPEKADESINLAAEKREFAFLENDSLLESNVEIDGEEFGVVFEENNPLLDGNSNLANKKGYKASVPQMLQDLGTLHSNDRSIFGVGRRGNRFHVGDLVRKILSLPDEERVTVLDLFNFDDKHLTVSDYNDILMALVKAGEFESAEALFSEFSLRGLSPDSCSFSTMIDCFCKKNDPDKAKEILDLMLQKGFHPNIFSFTGLISCLCKRGRLKMVYEVFDVMGRVGCVPTIRNYNSLIYGLCYVGKIEEAFQLLNKIKKSTKAPDIYTYTSVMDGFCKVGRTDEARELLEEALDLELTPINATYNCLVNGYCKEGRPLEALPLLKEMEGRDCHPDNITYMTLLRGLLKWGKISASLSIFKKMREAGFLVDDRIMNILIRGLCRISMKNGEKLDEAKELFEEILDKDLRPSPYTFCLMIHALAEGEEIHTAVAYLLRMIKYGYCPRIMAYNVILRILCGKGWIDDAFTVFILVIEKGAMPSKFSVGILIDEFNRQGRLQQACEVYSVAIKRGIFPRRKPRRE